MPPIYNKDPFLRIKKYHLGLVVGLELAKKKNTKRNEEESKEGNKEERQKEAEEEVEEVVEEEVEEVMEEEETLVIPEPRKSKQVALKPDRKGKGILRYPKNPKVFPRFMMFPYERERSGRVFYLNQKSENMLSFKFFLIGFLPMDDFSSFYSSILIELSLASF